MQEKTYEVEFSAGDFLRISEFSNLPCALAVPGSLAVPKLILFLNAVAFMASEAPIMYTCVHACLRDSMSESVHAIYSHMWTSIYRVIRSCAGGGARADHVFVRWLIT